MSNRQFFINGPVPVRPVDLGDELPQRITNSSSRKPLNLADFWKTPTRTGSQVAFSLPSKTSFKE